MTARRSRVVIDTNVFVSAILRRQSVSSSAVQQALRLAIVLTSRDVLAELTSVLARSKFEKAASLAARRELLASYAAVFEPIDVNHSVDDCRDPRDNMFLELALSGKADVLITGDQDLLCLHPWRGIAILSPADYLAQAE